MPRYKAIVEYDGTHLYGLQRQAEHPTVQQHIEDSIYALSGGRERVTLHAAGRTDRGVHAKGQVVHWDMQAPFPMIKLHRGLNFYLARHGISLVSIDEVDETFHARFSAKGRSYCYRLLQRSAPPVLDANRVWHIRDAKVPLDIEAMRQGAVLLIGTHDFTSFRSTECQSKDPVKTLDRLDVQYVGDEIHFYAEALSFLHHQVRNMVGTLVHIGRHKWEPSHINTIFDAKDRAAAGPTAPACGLYFMSVMY